MSFGEAIKTCFSKYATAQRSEFCYFVLLFVIAEIAEGIIDDATRTGAAGYTTRLCSSCPVSPS